MQQQHEGTTDKQQKDVALRQDWSPVESAHLLRSTLDGLASHLVVLDNAGNILFTNKAYRDFAVSNGADADAVSERVNYLAICDAAAGHDAEYAWAFARGLREVMAGTRTSFQVEYPCHSPGEQRWFIARVNHVSGDNTGLVIVTHENVTERVEADARLRKLSRAVEQSVVTIVVTDRDGRIEYANPHFEKVSGYTVAEAIGLNPRLLQSGDTPRETYTALWNTVLAGNEWRGELKNKRKNGTFYWENVIISPVRDASGVISNFVAVKEDITEHKRLLDERTKLQTLLNHAQKMESVGRLAGGVAHDFNNLLTVITGTVELALASATPAETYTADLATILQAAQRGTALTRQLLTFSRQGAVTARNIAVNDVVTPMLSMLRRLVGEDVTIVTELAQDAGVVRVDVGQLEQVITNLTVNARDAMPRGGCITVSTARILARDARGDTVRLTVRDTGTGMSAVVQDRLFEPFFTTKAIGKGTGLGLAIVYGIVTQSGGTVTVDSTLNVGTAFHIALPSRDEAASAPREPEQGGLVRGSGVVLVVDDEPALGNITQRILQHAGYTVMLARSGAEAIQMAEALDGQIDLLLSDVIMPEMYGPELAAVLRAKNDHLRVMFVSGHSGDVLTSHGLEGRNYAFLAKPFSIPELTQKVRDVMAR